MEHNELLKWAIKGLSTEIEELDKTVRKGKGYLTDYYIGKQPKTKATPEEIKKLLKRKKNKSKHSIKSVSNCRGKEMLS